MRHYLMIAVAAGLIVATGCRHRCCRPASNSPPPRPFLPSAPSSPYLLPPAGVPTAPAPGNSSVVPPVGPVDPRNYPPPVLDPITPAPSTKPPTEILFPDPLPGGSSSRSASPGDPGPGVLGGPVKPQTSEPPVSAKPPTGAAGLPGYVRVKEGVATGRKPGLDGFDSLKQAGYRTMIYLHPAGADLSAVRDLVARRGFALVAIETTPEKLSAALQAFNAALADKSARPVYVFDDDGVRAGALWYLHFRTVEAMNDDTARVRARPLGFTDQGDEARAFDLAIQRYLETR